MADFFISRRFYTPENEIVILSPVKLFSQHTHTVNQFFFSYKQMTNIINGTQQINVKIRLEMWLKEFMTIHRHFIFIRINHFNIPVFIQNFHTFI